MHTFWILALTAALSASPTHETYPVPGAAVEVDLACHRAGGMAVYRLVATRDGAGRYTLPGLSAYPRVSLLTTHPGQVQRDGDIVTWRQHEIGDELWIIAGGLLPCPTSAPRVAWAGRVFVPVVLR